MAAISHIRSDQPCTKYSGNPAGQCSGVVCGVAWCVYVTLGDLRIQWLVYVKCSARFGTQRGGGNFGSPTYPTAVLRRGCLQLMALWGNGVGLRMSEIPGQPRTTTSTLFFWRRNCITRAPNRNTEAERIFCGRELDNRIAVDTRRRVFTCSYNLLLGTFVPEEAGVCDDGGSTHGSLQGEPIQLVSPVPSLPPYLLSFAYPPPLSSDKS